MVPLSVVVTYVDDEEEQKEEPKKERKKKPASERINNSKVYLKYININEYFKNEEYYEDELEPDIEKRIKRIKKLEKR